MRTIGIDLAVKAAHKAVVVEANGQFVTPVLSFYTRWDEIEQVVARAREGIAPDYPLQAVMEPTGMAWFTVAIALRRLGVMPYLVNGQHSYDLRRFYKRHSSSDRISARVLAKMPLARTPFDRLCVTTAIPHSCRTQLQMLRSQINPRQLQQEIYALLDYIFSLPGAVPGQSEDVHQLLATDEHSAIQALHFNLTQL